jgi:signal transduction histidine kinase
MSSEKPTPDESGAQGGRVIYSRPRTDDASRERDAGVMRRYGAAPTLLPLLVGFALLLALIFALGALSVRRLNEVSAEVLDLQRQRGSQLNFLLALQNAANDLNTEARARSDMEARGGIIPPMALRLRAARATVSDLLGRFDSLPISRTERGRALAADLRSFIEVTENGERYQLEGFERFRAVTGNLRGLLEDAGRGQSDVIRRTEELQAEAARRIYFWTMIAALFGAVVALASVLEVQRRFRQMRRSLAEAERERHFSSQLLGGMVSAVAAMDARGVLRSANTAFFNFFPNAVIGSSVHDDFTHPEEKRMLISATATAVEEATYRGRWMLSDHGRETATAKTVDVYVSPLDIDNERGLIVTLVDVTEAVEAERESRRRESLAAVGQAAAQVAHEIKNPLGSIRLGISMLSEMAHDPQANTIIALVERGIDHLNKLTIDVTDFSGEKSLTVSEVDLHELIDSSLELIKDRIEKKRTPIEKTWRGEEDLRARVDEDQLRQVLVNLLANAVDASAEESPVRISAERVKSNGENTIGRDGHRPFARITIIDRGVGMKPEVQRRIFEPFFTTKKRGTGLGLAISKKIVEQHGGRIEVASAPGEGTSFTIELPLTNEVVSNK